MRALRKAFASIVGGAALVGCAGSAPSSSPQAASASVATVVASASASAQPVAPPGLHFDIGALDRTADPCVDFYTYACGGWRASHPIPPDQARTSRYAELVAKNAERERAIVEEAASASDAAPATERRVGAYYRACMDDQGIEAHGLGALDDAFRAIAAIKDAHGASDVIGLLHAHSLDAAFSVFVDPDPHDPSKRMFWIDRGSVGLRDPATYTRKDDASEALRTRYVQHLERVFALLGEAPDVARRSARATYDFEHKLAEKALSAVDARATDKQDHAMTIEELEKRFPGIDWNRYFERLGAKPSRVNVTQPAWLDAVSALGGKDLEGERAYFRYLVVRTFASVLPKAIEEEVFDFRQRALRGTKEMPPRWKRCMDLVDRDVGDDVGRIFVERHFPAASRAGVAKMIDALLTAYRADIDASEWLGPDARKAARAKLDAMLVVIGASNRPRTFDGLDVRADDAFGNGWRGLAFDVARTLRDLDRPTDREEFFGSLPQELDGFGSKPKNATGFTAGFLQPPVYDPSVDDAVNFGGLGSVIGHELTHHLDDEGRKFDASGTLRSWWSPDDVARFEERAKCFIDEYSAFKTENGNAVDGKLTLGENIADNGGIRLSYAALQASASLSDSPGKPGETGPKIDGYTPAQRFFLAWGQIRCENVTPEAEKRQVEGDPHSPGRFRVNGVVSNMPEFARAFSCTAGAPMAPTKRCAVW